MSYILYKEFMEIPPQFWPTPGATFDIENVLTDFHGNMATAEDAVLRDGIEDYFTELALRNVGVALITHNRSDTFVASVQGQVEEAVKAHVPTFAKADGQPDREKTQPGVFLEAARALDLAPKDLSHVDDQWKSHRGARQAGYRHNIWTKPSIREHQHLGVRIGRIAEYGLIRPAISLKQPYSDIAVY